MLFTAAVDEVDNENTYESIDSTGSCNPESIPGVLT